MPELPEVETMVRGIRDRVEGSRVLNVVKCRCACRPIDIRPTWPTIRRRAQGQTIASVSRRAKRVVLELDSGDAFVIEPRMTGLMLVSDPPDREHVRIEWRLEKGGTEHRLWFWDRRGLGTLRLFSPAEIQTHLGPGKLGPDALQMTENHWRDACRKTARPIKVAMLDQKIVAGIGNIYASEILHLAGISPARMASELEDSAFLRLARATQTILQQAIESEGSTLSDGTYRNALNQNGGYQNQHRVYQKDGQTCSTCGEGIIERTVLGQRATFFCPACQRSQANRRRSGTRNSKSQ